MNKKIIHVYLLFLCSTATIFANDPDIDDLLNVYATKSDLSEQTKKENSGNLILYTRKDLEIMQARNLKDILKSNPFIRYKENRFSIPDILYTQGAEPVHSSSIRVFIDEQEVVTASYGSGFAVLGDIDLGFVDHIEIYSLNPSFEYTTESTTLFIKIYSKIAERDKGGSFELGYGTRNFNQETLYYADTLENFSYFAYLSRYDDNKASTPSNGESLSKDMQRYNAFLSLYNKTQKIQFQALSADRDGFAGTSTDATPTQNYHDYDAFYLSYYNTMIEHLEFGINYTYGQSEFYDYDDHPFSCFSDLFCLNSITVKSTEHILSAEAKYHLEFNNHRLFLGVKYRHKQFTTDKSALNDIELPPMDYDTQKITSLYIEDQYALTSNFMLSAGLQYTHVTNNADVINNNLTMARLGMTYSDERLTFKTFGYHTESIIEPYINHPLFLKKETIQPQTLQAVTQEIRYKPDQDEIKLLMSYINIKDQLITRGLYHINNDDDVTTFLTYAEYTYPFDIDNKIIINYSYKNITDDPVYGKYIRHRSFIRSLNRIGDYDIFNELIAENNTYTDKTYYDYSAGITYRAANNVTLSIKGENLFNTAVKDIYMRRDPIDNTLQSPLRASPIEQRVYATMRYTF